MTYYLLLDAILHSDGAYTLYDILAYSTKAGRDADTTGNYPLDLEIDDVVIAVKDRLRGQNTQLHDLWTAAAHKHLAMLAARSLP